MDAIELTLPGLANIHCHAFQRAMAGLAERQTDPADSFWTWRELMYRFAGRITPESQYDIAAQLYAEMLESGYSSVCEFHYLHHRPDGEPYGDRAAMSDSLIAAARDTGIRLTLLPVLYMTGGFDGRALSDRQRRFGHAVDAYLGLLERLRRQESDMLRVGIAFHSLRAVPPDALRDVLAAVQGQSLPIHIHIAEQIAEVEECVAVRGARPVEWLLANAAVDARWTLVHATHLTHAEVRGIAASEAVVALCPTTEANLGDGLFPLRDFFAVGGRFGIGSDSNVSVSPVEELRWLEYGQRLLTHQRNVATLPTQASVGEVLFTQALTGGRQASGFSEAQAQRDRIRLDADAVALVGARPDNLLDRFVFAGNRPMVQEVEVAGRIVVRDGRHIGGAGIAERYRRSLRALLADG